MRTGSLQYCACTIFQRDGGVFAVLASLRAWPRDIPCSPTNVVTGLLATATHRLLGAGVKCLINRCERGETTQRQSVRKWIASRLKSRDFASSSNTVTGKRKRSTSILSRQLRGPR